MIYGGVSSQPEFHRGASRSPRGKAIVCLASTQLDGSSAIHPTLHGNEVVVIPRADMRGVVTEYGINYLFGKSLRERAVVALKNDVQVLLRPSRGTVASLIQDLFFRMRAEDVYTRFFRNLRSLTLEMAEHLCSVGYDNEMAFVATVGEVSRGHGSAEVGQLFE